MSKGFRCSFIGYDARVVERLRYTSAEYMNHSRVTKNDTVYSLGSASTINDFILANRFSKLINHKHCLLWGL
jgi:hypothetical protein